ncbi:ATP-dependent zinc protease family protein [Aestuariispira ectoiniformans]|uniref:ATP-dependent zinc protease family protein n=1 Tax=Aestuariispira ectoiniformans TaxID=2775080 RepID=UPI00223ADC93|nr:ATP-dependent zinc protease [Aestuariispira ectoiniformans]
MTEFSDRELIGWREWVSLPDFGIDRIKAKIDTGARSSALHAWDIEPFRQDGEDWVRFNLHPFQRNDAVVVSGRAKIVDQRPVTNSGGTREDRFFIQVDVVIGHHHWPIEVNLTNRDQMGFRMLLGRTALQERVFVAPDKSYVLGRNRNRKRKTNKKDRPSNTDEGQP